MCVCVGGGGGGAWWVVLAHGLTFWLGGSHEPMTSERRRRNAIAFPALHLHSGNAGQVLCSPGHFYNLITSFKTHHYIIFLFDNYILSREWRVIVDQVQTNYPARPMMI